MISWNASLIYSTNTEHTLRKTEEKTKRSPFNFNIGAHVPYYIIILSLSLFLSGLRSPVSSRNQKFFHSKRVLTDFSVDFCCCCLCFAKSLGHRRVVWTPRLNEFWWYWCLLFAALSHARTQFTFNGWPCCYYLLLRRHEVRGPSGGDDGNDKVHTLQQLIRLFGLSSFVINVC